MNYQEIIEAVRNTEDKNHIYLLDAIITGYAGFFTSNGLLFYIAKDLYNYSTEFIETEFLLLQTHVRIESIKNNQSFESGYYNLISYRGKLEDHNIVSFIKLCRIHAENTSELEFKEFFYSLIELFQLPSEQSYNNALGFFGELKFMQHCLAQYNKDISSSWHRSGPFSKYDFSNGYKCIEIKSTSSDENKVSIKHKQIFENKNCYLGVIICEKDDCGESIEELLNNMLSKENAFNSIRFNINVARELKRVSTEDLKELKFTVESINLYCCNEINPFDEIPSIVNNLKYDLDISDLPLLPYISSSKVIELF